MAETKQMTGGKVESIGTVKTIVGEVKAVDASGNERILQAGDKVFPNETIVTAAGALVLIEFVNGTTLDLPSSSQIVLDSEVFNPALAEAKGEEGLTAEQIQEMIARGEDPTAVTEATAAGAGAGDEGGSSFIVVDFNNTQGDVTSGFNTLGIPGPESTTFTELPPVEDEPLPVIPDTVPTTEVTTVAVDEDDLGSYRGEESILNWWWTWQGNNDTAPGDDIVPDSTTVVSGVLNIAFGADVPGSVAFNAAGTQPALTSGGLPVQYFVSDDGLTIVGYVVYTDEYEESTYEKPIFAATIDDPATGAFTFYLLGNIDHTDPTTEDNFVLNLGYTATDSEGDAAAGILAVNIDDDSPVLGYSGCEYDSVNSENVYVPTAYVDEDDLKPGNDDSAGGDDWGYNPYYVYLPISFGADGPAAENALVLSAAGITDQNGQTLTSGDQPLQYVWDAATQTLTAYIGTVDTESYQEIFTLQVDYVGDYGAELLFTLKGPLDHPENDTESPEDNLVFNVTYTAFDGDGDSVQGTLAVNVDDDSPVAGADSAVVFAGESVTIDVTGNDSVGADRPGTWSNGGSYTFDADGKEPGVYNDTYTLTDGDNDEATGNISVQVLGRPVVNFTDGETNVDSLIVDEDGSVTVYFEAEAQAGSELTALTVTGFNPDMDYDFSALGVEDTDYTWDGTTLTILNLTGAPFSGSFVVTPPADSDVDVGTLTATATAAAIADSNVTADSSNSVDVYTDAVADAPVIDIEVSDSADGNATFQANESGTVTVYATFGDSTDGSETHTVVVNIPVGFSVDVAGLPLGAVYDSQNNTVTFSGVGAVLDTSFTVTNTGSPDGVATFSGTASTEETTFSGEEPDLSDNTASDDDSADASVSSVPTPSVTLGAVGADDIWMKEDGAATPVSLTASTNAGSTLTSLTVTGFVAGFTYDFSALGAEGTDWTFDGSTLTLLGLSGTSFSGSFTVAPDTADSDADLGTLTAQVVATSDTDASVTQGTSDTATVKTDAVLDEGVDVEQTSTPEVNESASAQLVGLNLDATSIAPFTGSGAGFGGDDTDTSESVTATVTLTAGVLYAAGVEQTEVSGEYTFTGTADEVVEWLESLQVEVPGGYDGDGTISGTVNVVATDTATDDEDTTADNSYSSNGGQTLDFTVSIDSVPVANDDSAVIFTGQSVTLNLTTNDDVGDDTPGSWSEGANNGTEYTFSATGNNAAAGVYNDNYTLTDSDNDTDDADITVTVLDGPTVTLGATANGDEVWLKEDGSAQSVSLSATAATGSHLTGLTVTGFVAGFTYNFSALGTEGTDWTFNSSTGTLTILGLGTGDTSFSGSFTVTPATVDSDADLGTLTAQVQVAANIGTATTSASNTVVVKTDAVLDQYANVSATAQNQSESTTSQTVSLGTSMSLDSAGFTGSMSGGADGDGSETRTVTLTLDSPLPLNVTLSSTGGTVTMIDATHYSITGADLVAAVNGLQVTVPAGFEGSISGSIASTSVDTATDSEQTTADNSKPDSASFSVNFANVAPVAQPDQYSVVEGAILSGTGLLTNDTDAGGDTLTVAVYSATNSGSGTTAGTSSITTALGGTLTVNANGTFSYTAPVRDHGVDGSDADGSDVDYFYYKATDGSGQSAWVKVDISVLNTVPDAMNDYNHAVFTTLNGVPNVAPVVGNVLTNDVSSQDTPSTVTAVNGTPVSGTAAQVQGEFGMLTINTVTGLYSYQYNATKTTTTVNPLNQAGAKITAFGDGVSPISGSTLNTSATPNGTVEITGSAQASKEGFGVGDSKGPDTIDFGEYLVFELAKGTTGEFQFQIGQFNANQSDPSDMTWYAFKADGTLITSGDLTGGVLNNNGVYVGEPILFTQEVKYVVFTNSDPNGQGYTVTDIIYESYPTGIDDFTYQVTDSDGDTDTAHLYITTDDHLIGTDSGNTLATTDGEDILEGKGGNDILNAGAGDDILIGGLGDDTLTGGSGKDMYVWQSGESGTDTVIGFTKGIGGDVLNLADLLQGEHATAGSLGGYLSFNYTGGNTVITIDTNGATTGGNAQTIVLQGVDLTSNNTLSATTIITNLLTDGNLKTDL